MLIRRTSIVLALAAVAMGSAVAAGPPDGLNVNVVNTPANPVPVTGSATVSGSVAATQSGTWTVGISGQPIVVINMDERGRAPYQETKEPSHTSCGTAVCGMEFQFSAVPSGKRLVVTGVSVDFIVLTGASVFAGELELGATSLFLPFLRQGGPLVPGTEEWVSNQQVTFYIEPTRAPTVFANVDPSTSATKDRLRP